MFFRYSSRTRGIAIDLKLVKVGEVPDLEVNWVGPEDTDSLDTSKFLDSTISSGIVNPVSPLLKSIDVSPFL